MLELILAVVMLSSVVIAISLLVPKAAGNISNNRHKLIASNFAASRIQELKEQPYDLVPVTPYSNGYFASNAVPGGCDCGQLTPAQWTSLPSPPPPGSTLWGGGPDALYTEDGVTYTRNVCIDFIQPLTATTWNTYCPPTPPNPLTFYPSSATGPDFGLKNIRVHVTWAYGGSTNVYDTQSQVTQQ